LVGRERELQAAKNLLLQNDIRMVTLTGPGGTEKTRLAVQLAEEVAEQFAGESGSPAWLPCWTPD
jgi:predicted ATPase